MPSTNVRQLRKNLTHAEKALWSKLRFKQLDGHRFRRQIPIGPYIIDFACLASRLLIELDGGQHADTVDADQKRTRWLETRGYRVLRFWNNDVLDNSDGVLETIRMHLTPHPNPPPQGGRESDKRSDES
jgi:very-short-patch-repair endonuclease